MVPCHKRIGDTYPSYSRTPADLLDFFRIPEIHRFGRPGQLMPHPKYLWQTPGGAGVIRI
jgi:hypothetical protein